MQSNYDTLQSAPRDMEPAAPVVTHEEQNAINIRYASQIPRRCSGDAFRLRGWGASPARRHVLGG